MDNRKICLPKILNSVMISFHSKVTGYYYYSADSFRISRLYGLFFYQYHLRVSILDSFSPVKELI
jgi:hypothetical protein